MGNKFTFDLNNMPNNKAIFDAMLKCQNILEAHTNIFATVSGGSDSDTMMDMLERCKHPHNKITYIFFNTGIEFEATKRHLEYLENKYDIKIERMSPKMTVPGACAKYGQPIFAKRISELMSRLQAHGFQWEDEPIDVLLKKYSRCKSALRWWCNDFGKDSQFNINRKAWLKEFIVANPPQFQIANKCCEYAKKKLIHECEKNHEYDLSCSGVRKAEGGARATAYKNCYTKNDEDSKVSTFRPIFWLSNKDKAVYKEFFGLEYSDCYTKYKMIRTGCTGCPFAKDFKKELETVEKYEPILGKVARKVFRNAYPYQEAYLKFRDEQNKKYGSYQNYLRQKEKKI